MGTATAPACQQRASQYAPIIHRAAITERELEMHRWIAAISSALLIPGLATAATAAATPFINFSKDTSDDRIEAAGSFSINLFAGSFTLINNVSPRVEPVSEVLLSRSQPKDIDNSDIQFPVSTDDFGSWPGEDWPP
jgi:hypothetical protein